MIVCNLGTASDDMGTKKRHGFWNVLVVITVIICLLALTSHYKNWIRTNANDIQILSGFYYNKVDFSELDSVVMVEKIPPMERLNGFSALEKEKGVFREFKDSLTDKKVYVYVDHFPNPKIKLVYRDSLRLFMNLRDSLENEKMYLFLKNKKDSLPLQFSSKK